MTTTKQGVKGLGKSFWGGRRGPTGKLATEEERFCKGERMVMVWREVVHENEGHKNRKTTLVTTTHTKNKMACFLFLLFWCVLVGKSRHKNVAHIPPIQGYP